MSLEEINLDENAEYSEEARRLWGDTKAYREYGTKTAGKSAREQKDDADGLTALFGELGELKERSVRDDEVLSCVASIRRYITDHYYVCTDEIFSGLGKMYSADERFRKNIDKAGGDGTAVFASAAIEYYLQNK